MAFIYDLDNEYGGYIIADADSKQAALQVNNNAAHPAIGIYSTASGAPIKTSAIQTPVTFNSGVTNVTAVQIGKSVLGNETNAPLVFANLSMASVPIIDFGGNFVSTASIELLNALGTAQKWIVVRAGNINYGMPLFGLSTAVNGPGAY